MTTFLAIMETIRRALKDAFGVRSHNSERLD